MIYRILSRVALQVRRGTSIRPMQFVALLLLVLATSGFSSFAAPPETLRFFQLNVLHEGTSVPNGFDQLVDIIIASDADIITLSEVRNYDGVDFHRRLLDRITEVQRRIARPIKASMSVATSA